jgi:hypothetical protein
MLYTDPSQMDLKKYKRLFVFGCSFTNYRWDSWADVLRREMPEALYINTGSSGAGQSYISAQLSQHINMFNPGPDDLVAIMWSTFYREDRYVNNDWITPGNIFTQAEYPASWMDYMDRRGMTIRDLATIDHVMHRLQSANFDSFAMLSVPVELQSQYSGIDQNERTSDLIAAYQHLNNMLLPDLMTTQFADGWDNSYTYWDDQNSQSFTDYHPSIVGYAEYLTKIGFQLSDSTLQYVQSEHERLLAITHKAQLRTPQSEQLF